MTASSEPVSQAAAIAENMRRGVQEIENGRPDQAARFFERVQRDDPDHADAHHYLAILSDRDGDYSAAERHYTIALEGRPADSELWTDLGRSYLLQKRFVECERALRTALAADPANDRAIDHLGDLYHALGDSNRANAVKRLARSGVDSDLFAAAEDRLTPESLSTAPEAHSAELITSHHAAEMLAASADIIPASTPATANIPRCYPTIIPRPGLIEPRDSPPTLTTETPVTTSPMRAALEGNQYAAGNRGQVPVDNAIKKTAGASFDTSAGQARDVRDLPLWTSPSPASPTGPANANSPAQVPAGWFDERAGNNPQNESRSPRPLPPPLF